MQVKHEVGIPRTGRSASFVAAKKLALELLIVALVTALSAVWLPPRASAHDEPAQPATDPVVAAKGAAGKYKMSKPQGDYLIKNMKVWIKATNSRFTVMNYAKAISYMGGSDFWRLKRRQTTAYWYFVGKRVNNISDSEAQVIVQKYWPTPPSSCGACLVAAGPGARPRSSVMFEQNGFMMNTAIAQQISQESGGVVDLTGNPTTRAQACTGVTRTVKVAAGYDAYYNSCDTDKMLRWLGYSSTACGSVFGGGTLSAIVAGAKRASADRGLSLGAALLGAACWLGTTAASESMVDAQNRSDKNAVIKKVRKMGYTPYPTPRYLTDTRWESQ